MRTRKAAGPFVTTLPHETVATAAWADHPITSAVAAGPLAGMTSGQSYVTGMNAITSKSVQDNTKAKNYVPTGNAHQDAPSRSTERNTFAPDAEAPRTALMAALMGSSSFVRTTLNPDAWEKALLAARITHKYPLLVHSIHHGFDVGIPHIHSTFSPPNNIQDTTNQLAFTNIMSKELQLGRWIGPLSQEDLEDLLGPFQTSPITMIPKSGKPGRFRLLENLSYPYHPIHNRNTHTMISSINSHIDSSLYPCLWGTYTNTCTLIWPLPPDSQGAVRDIAEAYRLVPLHPKQWPGAVI